MSAWTLALANIAKEQYHYIKRYGHCVQCGNTFLYTRGKEDKKYCCSRCALDARNVGRALARSEARRLKTK